MNGALETIEDMVVSVQADVKHFVVRVTAYFTACHNVLLS